MAGLCAPCRRFAPALTDDSARLGADVDRYSFIAVDLHHLLLAGLPAHAKRYNPYRNLPDLILRSRGAASRRMNGTSGASWFETALRASSP